MTIPAKASASCQLCNAIYPPPQPKLTRWSHKTLRCSDAETHTAVQNLRQEVGEGVRHGGQTTETHRKAPDLEIKTRLQELDEVERLCFDICSVCVDTSNDKVDFALVEEAPCLLGRGVGKGDEETVSHDSDANGENALDDENPATSSVSKSRCLRESKAV